ncbi:MAG: hypothetical protein R2809_08530 [Flavobacteriales bacterium]
MKLLLDIPDGELNFAMKVLKSLSFVRKVKPMTPGSFELLEHLQEATEEVKKHRSGKLKLKSARELLDEL